ncbi:hypothetical protein [Phenylobacterium zucineum]|uniref:hypothetical protein n=1 Tax=Phenylobacterium zucineum TaxID=284016 RepID=UPI0003114CF8|nr:hypothetical protein [Phenylobacterium zucineum]
MSQRFLRHNIVGSEAGRPRPLVYMRQGWSRSRLRRRSRSLLPALLGAAALAVAAGLWLTLG